MNELVDLLIKQGFTKGRIFIRKTISKNENVFTILITKDSRESIICITYNEIIAKGIVECLSKHF